MKRVHDSLEKAFQKKRLVFWYDPDGQWLKEYEGFAGDGINKVRVEGNEFAIKVAIHRDPDPYARYLLYFPSPRPRDAENWLLDLLFQGHEYKADRVSLALQEVGLPYDFRHLAEEHIWFFNSAKRMNEFKALLTEDDNSTSLRLKMMAVMAGTPAEIDSLLLSFLSRASAETLIDPVEECFGSARLTDYFWKAVGVTFGYAVENPSLRDFVAALFKWANPLDPGTFLLPHARVFLQHWKDSQACSSSFREWAGKMESELHVAGKLESLDGIGTIADSDLFPIFEKFVIQHLCRTFGDEDPGIDIPAAIQGRRNSFWYPIHKDGYEALDQAVIFRKLVAGSELEVQSIGFGIASYAASWHRIDTAYRKFCYHLRRYGQVAVMERISRWVEKTYVNNYLLPLADRWSDQVRGMAAWKCREYPVQSDFFKNYAQPFLNKGQKVIVIISDALRYEAAAEFTDLLRAENRWTAKIEPMLGSLPSYTQLGMASLLPGKEWSIQIPEGTVLVDGKSAGGTAARKQILSSSLKGKATAIQSEEFLEMNTRTEARALIRDNEVIFIFHNTIDKIGDSAASEAKTSEAVEDAFQELLLILRKVASANGNNMILTSDHGFLFQQSAINAGDDHPLPEAGEWFLRARRYALGSGITASPAIKIFSAQELGLAGDWQAAFPLSLGRFPLKGSGKRYVHGGLSLQEVIIPVVSIHKARSDDTRKVEVEPLRLPGKITTGKVSLALYQSEPVADKVLPRKLRVGVYAPDGKLLSEVATLNFDSSDTEPRKREQRMVLTLSRLADRYNNSQVEIRLEETLAGTNQTTVYKNYRLKMQKPFAGDFDDF